MKALIPPVERNATIMSPATAVAIWSRGERFWKTYSPPLCSTIRSIAMLIATKNVRKKKAGKRSGAADLRNRLPMNLIASPSDAARKKIQVRQTN